MVSFKHLVLIHAMMSVFASASAEIVIMTETDTSSGTSTDTAIKIEEYPVGAQIYVSAMQFLLVV